MAVRPLTGVGRPWPSKDRRVLPEGRHWSSSGGGSQATVMVACLFQPPRCGHCHRIGEEAILLTFRSLLSDLGLGDFTLVLCPSSHLQSNTNKQKGGKKMLCSQTKLSFIASTLTYPYWRNVSAPKLAPWHGYSATRGNRDVFVFGICYLFFFLLSLLFEMANPLLITHCFYSVYYQNYTPPTPPQALFIY